MILAVILSLSACKSKPINEASSAVFADDIRNAVKEHIPEFVKCYEAIPKKKNVKLENIKVIIGFTVTPDHKVKNSKIVSNTSKKKRPEFEKCILDAVNNFHFETTLQNDLEADITYPLVFEDDVTTHSNSKK